MIISLHYFNIIGKFHPLVKVVIVVGAVGSTQLHPVFHSKDSQPHNSSPQPRNIEFIAKLITRDINNFLAAANPKPEKKRRKMNLNTQITIKKKGLVHDFLYSILPSSLTFYPSLFSIQFFPFSIALLIFTSAFLFFHIYFPCNRQQPFQ